MRNYALLFLFGALITQSEIAYSSESKNSDRQDLKVVQQLMGFHRYSDQRQKEMREEAESLRPSFNESRGLILKGIFDLESQKRGIESSARAKCEQIRVVHNQAFTTLKMRKIQGYFQNFTSSGEVSYASFLEMVETCFLVGKMMNESLKRQFTTCTNEKDQALVFPNAKIAELNIEILGLENYALFNPCSPVGQLRTQFLTMYSLLQIGIQEIPGEILVEAELQEVKVSQEDAKVEAINCQSVIKEATDEMTALISGGDFAKMQLPSQTIQKASAKLSSIVLQQQELAHKKEDLETKLVAFRNDGESSNKTSCFGYVLSEIKNCAARLQQYSNEAEVQKLTFKFNVLSLQDHEFITNVLAFRTPTSIQGS